MMGRLLCRIGVHDWATNDAHPLTRCQCCGLLWMTWWTR